MASLRQHRWRLRAGLVAQHRLRRSALQCPHGAIGGGGNSTPSSVGSRARSRTGVSSPVAGLGVVPRCRRRRPSQCTRGAVVVGRQPGLTMLGGVIAGSGASVGRRPGSVWCRRRPDLHHLLGVSITCSYNTSSATWMDDDPANTSGRVCACKTVEELGEDRRLTCGASEDEARRHGFFPGSPDSLPGLCLASARLTRSPPAWCG